LFLGLKCVGKKTRDSKSGKKGGRGKKEGERSEKCRVNNEQSRKKLRNNTVAIAVSGFASQIHSLRAWLYSPH
jgi:hypothetical protein